MTTTVNGITAYEVTKDLLVQQFIREEGLTVEDKALLDAAETAAALVSGLQVIDVGGAITGGSATGLANDTTVYTMTVKVDGVDNAIAVTGSAAQTYTTLLTEINADLTGATAAIVSGNVEISSDSTGNASKIVITDTDLLATLTDFVAINAAVDGDLKTDLMSRVHTPTGKFAWDVYKLAVETYDPDSIKELLAAGDLADIVGAPAEADHNLVRKHLNAMKAKIVEKHNN